MTVSIGLPLLTGLWAFTKARLSPSLEGSQFFRFFQSSIALPALFGQRHSVPLLFKVGYVPTQALSCSIAIYVILNVVFSAVPFHSVQPNSWYSNRNQEIAAYVSNRTGVLSFANMALAIMFSTRNNPLAYFSGWTYSSFVTFHRWAARVAVLQAVVHSIVYTADYCYYMDSNMYSAEAAKPYLWWGIIATTAMALMIGASVLPLRLYSYETFLVVHIVLAILALIGCWYHIDIRFKKHWGYEVWLYIAFAFWSYDRVVRLIKVAYFSWGSKAVALPVQGTNVVSLTIYPGRAWRGRLGEHTFLYFPSLGRAWENHPFTIADWATTSSTERPLASAGTSTEQQSQSSDADSKEFQVHDQEKGPIQVRNSEKTLNEATEERRFSSRCYFRVHAGTTARFYHKLAADIGSPIPVLTEGPYGSHMLAIQPLKYADKILCIAGGIGITWAGGFAKQFAVEKLDPTRRNKAMPCCRQFLLAWSVREMPLLKHFTENLLPDLNSMTSLDDGSLRYRFWVTGENGENGGSPEGTSNAESKQAKQTELTDDASSTTIGRRMEISALIGEFLEPGKRHAVLIFGPGGLSDEVWSNVVTYAKSGFYVDLVEESFGW